MTDHELMARLKAGDQEALAELMARHRPTAVEEARDLLGDAALAEDMAQEAFARVYLARAHYQSDFTFRTWLISIVRHLCIDQLRRRKRSPIPSDVLPERPTPSVESEYLAMESRMRLWDELAALSDQDAGLLMGYALEELTYRELAARYHLSVGQVKIRLHRIRKRLREKERDD